MAGNDIMHPVRFALLMQTVGTTNRPRYAMYHWGLAPAPLHPRVFGCSFCVSIVSRAPLSQSIVSGYGTLVGAHHMTRSAGILILLHCCYSCAHLNVPPPATKVSSAAWTLDSTPTTPAESGARNPPVTVFCMASPRLTSRYTNSRVCQSSGAYETSTPPSSRSAQGVVLGSNQPFTLCSRRSCDISLRALARTGLEPVGQHRKFRFACHPQFPPPAYLYAIPCPSLRSQGLCTIRGATHVSRVR